MAITFAQNVHGGNTNDTSYIVNIAGTTAGNLVVVAVGSGDGSYINVTSVVDSAGNPYIQATGARTDSAFDMGTDIWYSKNVLGGATTVTVTAVAYVKLIASVYEFAGASITAPFVSAVNQQSTTGSTGPALTPASADTVIVGVAFNYNYNYNPSSATAPFIGVRDNTVTGFASAYQIDAAQSSQQCIFLPSTQLTNWASSAAIFTADVVASGNTSSMFLVF